MLDYGPSLAKASFNLWLWQVSRWEQNLAGGFILQHRARCQLLT
jgi:hypothetical protein